MRAAWESLAAAPRRCLDAGEFENLSPFFLSLSSNITKDFFFCTAAKRRAKLLQVRRVTVFTPALLPSSRIAQGVRLGAYDTACALAAPWLAFWLRDADFLSRGDFLATAAYCAASSAMALVMFVWLRVGSGLPGLLTAAEVALILKAAFAAVAFAAALMFSLTRLDAAPRSLLALNVLTLALSVLVGRLSRGGGRRRKRATAPAAPSEERNLLVVGANATAHFYIQMLAAVGQGRRKAIAILDENPRMHGRVLCGVPVVGSPRDLACIVDEYLVHGLAIHCLVHAGDGGAAQLSTLREVRRVAAERNIAIEFLHEQLGLAATAPGPVLAAAEQGGDAAPARHRRRAYWRAKRLADLAIALALAATLWPLAIGVALVVLIDTGAPVLFWQRRIGRAGKPFHIYKFRTLRPPFDAAGRPVPGARRLSSIGAFLRATRLDELPQLYNIVAGDMAFVGPRPLLPEDLPRDPELRLAVAPGLTGWAQVHGGRLIGAEEKNALDQWYVRHASFLLDAEIAARTAWTMLTGDTRHDAALGLALGEQQTRRGAKAAGAADPASRPAKAAEWPRLSPLP